MAGCVAIMLWACTAPLLAFCSGIPTLLLASLISMIGFGTFLVRWRLKGENISAHFRLPAPAILLAATGIGGYRLLYIGAFQFISPIEASLINYLWPVLIVLFSQFLPNEKPRWHHIAGALIAFLGIVVLLRHDSHEFSKVSIGHVLAFVAAIEWAAFSVISRYTKTFSSNAIPVSFGVTGLLFLLLHFTWHESAVTAAPIAWWAMMVLGISSSFGYFLWDVGMKHGSIQALSVMSNFVPLISTLLLIILGKTEAHPTVIVAAVLVLVGSLLAGKDKIRKPKQN
jgi:drug/metabolite transporter (DMT)-like permease